MSGVDIAIVFQSELYFLAMDSLILARIFFLQSNLETNVSQDFLYLSGILEPDSALVLYGKGRPDQAILFVPRRDPGRELWDGPRSGKDGAAALTGIERVHSTEELGVVLKSLKGEQTN